MANCACQRGEDDNVRIGEKFQMEEKEHQQRLTGIQANRTRKLDQAKIALELTQPPQTARKRS